MIILPEKFENDIQGKDTYLTPLVIINDSIYLSTGKTTLDGVHYSPLLKSLGNIKQSIDVYDKKFKISSVNMQFFNYDYNNTTLTETMFSSEIMNTSLDVYFRTPSAETLDDCLKVYTGYVKNISENIDSVTLEIEDRTEQTMHKDLPYRYTPSVDLPNKHKNIPIPIVYGSLLKAPIVYNKLTGQEGSLGEFIVVADDFYIKSFGQPLALVDDVYLKIKENADFLNSVKVDTIYDNIDTLQYTIEDNDLYISNTLGDTGVGNPNITTSTISVNIAEVEVVSKSKLSNAKYLQRMLANPNAPEWQGFDYSDLGNFNCTAKVEAFQDDDFQIPIQDFENYEGGVYVGVADWTNTNDSQIPIPFELMITGGANHWYSPYYSDIFQFFDGLNGYFIMNFEIGPTCSDSSIMKELKTSGSETKIINGKLNLDYVLEVKLTEYEKQVSAGETSGVAPDLPQEYPQICFTWNNDGEMASSFWNLEDDNPNVNNQTAETYVLSSGDGTIEYITDKMNVTQYILGSVYKYFPIASFWDDDPDRYASGIVDWFKYNQLDLIRTFIIDNFNDYDLYASVQGRVDNTAGRYTTSSILEAEQMRDYVEGKKPMLNRKSIAPTRPSARKPVARIPAKKKIKSKSTKGGY